MERIDLHTHAKDIRKTYEAVVRGEEDIKWVIYGPDSSKAYTVEETGTDFDEFLQGFDESQIQFGLARVNPPNSDVQKNLLIGWCPDSAPLKSRSSFAQNFSEVARLLKGYHIQVTARDTDDLDKEELLSRVSAAAGARYSIQAARSNASSSSSSSSNAFGASKPSSSAFKPKASVKPSAPNPTPKKQEPAVIRPSSSSKPSSRNEDADGWDEPEIEERDFSKNPLKPNSSTYKPIGRVNLQDVIKEENAKPDPRLEIQELKSKDRLKKDQELDEYLKTNSASYTSKAPTPVSASRSDKLVGGISKNFGSDNGKTPAQLWAERKKKESSEPNPSQDAPKSSFSSSNNKTQDEDEDEENVSSLRSKFDKLEVEAEEEEREDQTSYKPKFGKSIPGLTKSSTSKKDSFDDEDDDEKPAPLPSRASRGSVPPPPRRQTRPQSDEEEEEEEEPAPSLPARRSEAEPPAPSLPSRSRVQESDDEEPAPPLPTRASPGKAEAEKTQTAVAEYDYEASEDNELSFKEGDVIINIQFVDDDWWLGELKSGDQGLFPANYVTLTA